MKYKISSDIIIGNYLIESIDKKTHIISLNNLYEFVDRLDKILIHHDYFISFCKTDILNFGDNYSFFIDSIDEENIYIADNINFNMLNRYFRIGVPSVVCNSIKEVYEEAIKPF